jgi:hypothetical protein
MIALWRRIVTALALSGGISAMLVVAQAAPAAGVDSEGPQSRRTEPCVVGHRFEPGPIVDGHYRQPTRTEFEARMQELYARSQGSTAPCPAPPLPSTVDSGLRAASAPPNPGQWG